MNSDKLHRHLNSEPTVLNELHSKMQEVFIKKYQIDNQLDNISFHYRNSNIISAMVEGLYFKVNDSCYTSLRWGIYRDVDKFNL